MHKVLIVEDNDLNHKLFKDLLTIKNLATVTSKDGHNIVELVNDTLPSLILMDIQLKGVSGISLIRELKNNDSTKHIPIIAITAFAMHNDEKLILAAGCDMYLSKPVNIDNFFESIDMFIK